MHFHHCPYCYEAWECTASCTIEPDLEDRGRPFASHWRCQRITCLIEAAAERHDLQLRSYEAKKAITLRRLQSAPKIVAVSERSHEAVYDTLQIPREHRYGTLAEALEAVESGGRVVLAGSSHALPPGVTDLRGVSISSVGGASLDMTGGKLAGNFSMQRVTSRPARKTRRAAPTKIRPRQGSGSRLMGWERIAWQVTKAITLIKKVMTNPDARVVVVIRNEKMTPVSQFEAGEIPRAELAAWLRRAADVIDRDLNPSFVGAAVVPKPKDDEN